MWVRLNTPTNTPIYTPSFRRNMLACVLVSLTTLEGVTFETYRISNALLVIKFSKTASVLANQRYLRSSKLFFKNGKNLRQASELPV